MSRLISYALFLRPNSRLLKLPPYVSLLCIIAGIAWLVLLPLNDYTRKTYISENALLPGQVHTYFTGSDQDVFRAYKREVHSLEDLPNSEINNHIQGMFESVGLKVGRQNFTYESAGRGYTGENIYGILQAPRGDATEAIVLVAAWKNDRGEFNKHGVPLALALARYFKRWSLWSKDIIFVIPPESRTGTQAWVDAYHDAHDALQVSPLPLKSGALQGAIAIDYTQENRFRSLHIVYDGINGQLPNLDLINSVVSISNGQMGIPSAIQDMRKHTDKYGDRLRTMFRGMLKQGLGYASGPHSCFIPYHVDAVTLQPYGEGWQDEMAMGRIIEGSFRSLNNLLEHLHQSFFFYLLMNRDRFVSIGTYLPSAMILSANFTIMAIFYWVRSGSRDESGEGARKSTTTPPTSPDEHSLFLPLGAVACCHFLGAVPFYIFNNTTAQLLPATFFGFAMLNCILPFVLSHILARPSTKQLQLMKCFSLLLLGMFLSALATLNFSLSFLIGLLAAPLTFMQPARNGGFRYLQAGMLQIISPTTVLFSCATWLQVDLRMLLEEAAFGWNVWGMYTSLIVCCVWWPAWLISSALVLG